MNEENNDIEKDNIEDNQELENDNNSNNQSEAEDNIKQTQEAIKDGANLAKNISTGNVAGIVKNSAKLLKNKKVRRKILISIALQFIIIIFLASSFLGIFDAVGDVIQGIIDGITSLFKVDATDGSIDIKDEHIDSIINSIADLGISVEDLKLLGDYTENATEEEKQEAMRKYIRKFYEAQVVTETLNYYHKESTDTKKYGTIYVYRADENSTDVNDRKKLTYIPYEEMLEKQQKGDSTANNYFSIDSSDNLVIAATNQVITETGTNTTSMTIQSNQTTVSLRTIDYKSVVSKYTTQMNFLVYLTMISQNPEFVSAVVDLIQDSRIEITIMDNVSTNISAQTYKYTLNQIEYTEETSTSRKKISTPKAETTKTTTISKTPSANITYVKTWFCEQTIEYSKETEPTNSSSNNTIEVDDEQEKTLEGETWKTDQTYNISNTSSETKYEETSRSDVTFTLGESGDGERYKNGEISEPTFVGLMETEFKIPYSTRKEIAGPNLVSGAEMLFYLLQKDPELENMETIMRYALYLYSGNDYGVTELDGSIFDAEDFIVIGGGTGGSYASSEILKQYIRYWEHSTPPPTNADGTKYIIEKDPVGNLAVGYGVDIINGGFKDVFIEAGYSIELGAEVDIEFVDALEEQTTSDKMAQIKSITSGLDLTDYQINALTSRAYNCGVSGAVTTKRGSPSMNFVESYNAYWNEETDNLFEKQDSNADFNHSLYIQYMSKPVTADGTYLSGLERRRKSEWRVFQTGYYDVLDKWHSNTSYSGNILEVADQIHQAQINWTYSIGDDLFWNNIETSINNPNRVTCCATFVSSVIYKAGYFTEEQMNSFNYNYCPTLYNFLVSNGWEIINSYDALQAGDLVFMDYENDGVYDHVQLYAGSDTWYDAGSTTSIQRASPFKDSTWARSNFTRAVRPISNN